MITMLACPAFKDLKISHGRINHGLVGLKVICCDCNPHM